jgi:hypothetical protein
MIVVRRVLEILRVRDMFLLHLAAMVTVLL